MIPYDYQIELAKQAYAILAQHALVYLACEERTGKTLTALLVANSCSNVSNVLVVTKKNALEGWNKTLIAYSPNLKAKYTIINYHSISKLPKGYKPDLVILDEAHNYISGYPKPSAMHAALIPICFRKPIIYISATPHAQGYQQLYHQLSLSSWSPWARFNNFYHWFEVYGVPTYTYLHNREVKQYTVVKDEEVLAAVSHLFVTKTRKELGFAYEPGDKVHLIALDKSTKKLYNTLSKDKVATISCCGVQYQYLLDTVTKVRTALHMLEGGVAKIDRNYLVLDNREKIDYILEEWGDKESVVIFYNYIAEETKLRDAFKYATILQATSFAEGIDLSSYETLIVYSQDFSTARHTQRRARQANKNRNTPIVVHFLLVENAVSQDVYTAVSINKVNYVDSTYQRKELI
ncbi:DNA or RNA helicases of superfamily iI [Caudoviricetes sp.]|nr:DNA or RNA helicases of superfamily iI [Caudoviricetes sp.]